MADKISVIVPVYKTEEYLDKCVKSIINQTYKNLEIILVDDGSPDNCPKMCDDWANKDSRIKVIHKTNGGLSSARNAGIEAAAGNYLMFTDSDDFLEDDMIEFLYNLIKKDDYDLARCGFYFDDGKTLKGENNDYSVKYPDYDQLMIDLVSNGYTSGAVWNKIYKTESVKSNRFLDEDGCSEDIMFNFRFYQQNSKVVFCDVPKYHYMVRENSIVNSEFKELAYSIVRAKKLILESLHNNSTVFPYVFKSLVDSAFIVLSGCIRNKAFPDMQNELRSDILKYRKYVFKSNMFSSTCKIKTFTLWISPSLFKFVIWRKK